MKKAKMFLILFLTAVMCIMVLTACGDNENDGGNTPPTPQTYSLTLEKNGLGSVLGGGNYTAGTSVTASAFSTEIWYTFSGWYDGVNLVSSNASYTFTMPSNDLILTAKFNLPDGRYALSLGNIGEGSTNGNGNFLAGTSVTITATAESGYYFHGWWSDGSIISTSNPYTFSMPSNDYVLIAYITKQNVDPPTTIKYTLALEKTGLGSVSGGGSFEAGTSRTVFAYANSGNAFEGWYQGTTKLSSSTQYTFTMPSNALTLMAKFIENGTTQPTPTTIALTTANFSEYFTITRTFFNSSLDTVLNKGSYEAIIYVIAAPKSNVMSTNNVTFQIVTNSSNKSKFDFSFTGVEECPPIGTREVRGVRLTRATRDYDVEFNMPTTGSYGVRIEATANSFSLKSTYDNYANTLIYSVYAVSGTVTIN